MKKEYWDAMMFASAAVMLLFTIEHMAVWYKNPTERNHIKMTISIILFGFLCALAYLQLHD